MHTLIESLWENLHAPAHITTMLSVATHCIIALAASGAVYLFCDRLVKPMVGRMVGLTKARWDDIIFGPGILRAASFVIFATVLQLMLPAACHKYQWLYDIVDKLCPLLTVFAWVRLINSLLGAIYRLAAQDARLRLQPLKGLLQMVQLIVIIVGIIIGVSILLSRNPVYILSGLGASAAVLMLVFKDSILGVVAGIQLSANDMLRKGDWIVVPGTPVNGNVIDVTLTTVKVQNFDNTTVTVPPYNLISGSFQNWRGMADSGGRRIMRSVTVDARSVRFLDDDEVTRFSAEPWWGAIDRSIGEQVVNLAAFRAYLEAFLDQYAKTNKIYTLMVRQLQPESTGIPVQVYCFTNTTDWVTYEHIQADIFDHIYAVMSRFGLRIYQQPSSDDVRALTCTSPHQ